MNDMNDVLSSIGKELSLENFESSVFQTRGKGAACMMMARNHFCRRKIEVQGVCVAEICSSL